jgi:diguanylate cyclase (GGDEF)-like protein
MKTILVIEDDGAIRSNIAIILKSQGLNVIQAKDGPSGLQMAIGYQPDLVICDIMLPEMDGYEILQKLREAPETSITPFIFLSALADRSDMRQGMNLGADDYLTKPFTSAELINTVQARLQKQQELTQPYVNEMKRAAEELRQVAYTDLLTHLPNRILLRQNLGKKLKEDKDKMRAVLILNVNEFRKINSTFGQMTGDLMLQAIAKRLQGTVGSQDMVARLNADEFAIVLTEVFMEQDVRGLTQTILQNLEEPYILEGELIEIKVRIGIALYPLAAKSPEALINAADIAAQWCKQQFHKSHQPYQFYNEELRSIDADRRSFKTDLRAALERSEFELYYQPIVNLITGRLVGLEALLRWNHHERGQVSPGRFIPIAEEDNLILELGVWTLRTALTQIKAWRNLSFGPLKVSVNISIFQLKQPDFLQTVLTVLKQTDTDPSLLTLELNETGLMENYEQIIGVLNALRDRKIQISLDDFGVGYISLNYLKKLPIDNIKIDNLFINRVIEDPQDEAIVKAIINMAQILKLKVVAEGVETQAQLDFLRKHGCNLMQGYLYSPPLPVAEVEGLFKEERRLV